MTRPELPPGFVDDPPCGYDPHGLALGQICRQLPNGLAAGGTFYGPRTTTRDAAVHEAWACYQDVGGWVEYADGLAAEVVRLNVELDDVAWRTAASNWTTPPTILSYRVTVLPEDGEYPFMLDEVVLGSWLHLELMCGDVWDPENPEETGIAYWMRVGDMHINVHFGEGEPHWRFEHQVHGFVDDLVADLGLQTARADLAETQATTAETVKWLDDHITDVSMIADMLRDHAVYISDPTRSPNEPDDIDFEATARAISETLTSKLRAKYA